jgi:hypothetical protein
LVQLGSSSSLSTSESRSRARMWSLWVPAT